MRMNRTFDVYAAPQIDSVGLFCKNKFQFIVVVEFGGINKYYR